MDSQEFINLCKIKVADYSNARLELSDKNYLSPGEAYVVWSCKTLQNNKALLSTPISDGMYYELTYNGDKEELYFDAYKKIENIKYDFK